VFILLTWSRVLISHATLRSVASQLADSRTALRAPSAAAAAAAAAAAGPVAPRSIVWRRLLPVVRSSRFSNVAVLSTRGCDSNRRRPSSRTPVVVVMVVLRRRRGGNKRFRRYCCQFSRRRCISFAFPWILIGRQRQQHQQLGSSCVVRRTYELANVGEAMVGESAGERCGNSEASSECDTFIRTANW
jgi:hypothetical protein